MTYQNDPDRRADADLYDPRATRTSRSGFGWGAALLAALVIIGGIVMFRSSDHGPSPAANDRAPITNNVPVQTPAPIPNNNAPTR